MNLDAVDPQLHAGLRRLPSLDGSKKVVRLLGRVAPRLLRAPRPSDVTVRWGRVGRVPVRFHLPDRPSSGAALLWIHGGGLIIGSAKQDDALCSSTAHELGVAVISVEYRLAPEAPFPAALDDARAVWDWLQENGSTIGVDPTRVAIGGESAGAGIAASLAQQLLDLDGVQPIGQWLFAPMLDDRTAARRDLDGVDHPVWNNAANRFGWSAYLGVDPGGAVVPAYAVPAYAVPARRDDLSGLPPTWIYSGDIELFAEEIASYAERLGAAGVAVEYEVVPGAAHGFENWARSTPLAKELIGRAQRWLSTTLGRV